MVQVCEQLMKKLPRKILLSGGNLRGSDFG